MNIRYLLALFLGILSISTLSAQDVVVDNSLDSTAILIGEQVKMSTRVACKKGSKVIFPEFKNGYVTNGVEMLQAGSIDTTVTNDGNHWELTRTYLLTAFDSAVYVIPKIEVEVNGHKYLSKNEIGLKVNTVNVDLQHPDDFRPLKAPVETIFVWKPWLMLQSLAVWLLLIVFVYCYIQSLISKPVVRRVKITPPTPPQTSALTAINELKEQKREGDWQKQYFMALTDVLRTYLHERFHFNSKEMTSNEIIQHLNATGDAEALEELREILETADLVKFAKYPASMAESDRALLQAVDYIHTTKQKIKENTQPKERIIVVKNGQQRRQTIFRTAAVLSLFCSISLMFYTGYLLWLYFL